MKDGWFERLEEVIEAALKEKRTSKTALSKAANRGQNYVQQMLKNRKQPGIENLLGILKALGDTDSVYVMTGMHLTPEALEFAKLFSNVPDEYHDHAVALLEALAKAQEADGSHPAAEPRPAS